MGGNRDGAERMSGGMRFEVLGPVRGWLGDSELRLGSPQQRGVLAMLLLARGRQVPLDSLVDGLWQHDVPKAAAGTVRTYVSRLRRVLAGGAITAAACAPAPGGDDAVPQRCSLTSAGDGYVLQLGSGVLDLDQFEAGLREARLARQRAEHTRAATALRAALALWRGAALAGIPGPFAQSRRVPLAELHLAAQQDRLAIDVDAGEHVAAIADLRALLADHPFAEGVSESLMLALYKAGRQADALTVYDSVRRQLADELGVDPGPALQEMYQRILRADGSLLDAGARRGGAQAAGAELVLA